MRPAIIIILLQWLGCVQDCTSNSIEFPSYTPAFRLPCQRIYKTILESSDPETCTRHESSGRFRCKCRPNCLMLPLRPPSSVTAGKKCCHFIQPYFGCVRLNTHDGCYLTRRNIKQVDFWIEPLARASRTILRDQCLEKKRNDVLISARPVLLFLWKLDI